MSSVITALIFYCTPEVTPHSVVFQGFPVALGSGPTSEASVLQRGRIPAQLPIWVPVQPLCPVLPLLTSPSTATLMCPSVVALASGLVGI